MNEVREICERMLDTPPPPLRDSGDVLAAARRSVRRRRQATAASAGALTVVAVAVTLTLQGGSAVPAPPVAAPAPTTVAPPPATKAQPQHTPRARAAGTHATQLRRQLLATVPAGYATRDFPVNYDTDFDPTAVLPNRAVPAPENGIMSVAFAGILLSDSRGREGLLSANIWATASPDLLAGGCAAEPPSTHCEVRTVDGVRVTLTTWQDGSGRHISASRPLDGGALVVAAAQGLRSDETQAPLDGTRGNSRIKPSLTTLPFTMDQIAALAANPAMLQFP
ncbi:hypothetical protein [Asanoa iriomotensis]|uniref:Uncharacterized protein n=1 Tax=Asanoa iriomotensis TaxID=234613 RepID=A0ABQ4BZL5_9ACTN|nr:hypothetical protein [Asanoa iriomotensis]GIF55947.1 hypothetical protein Air01nite_20420 [Asanoa iriomotensis]